MTVTFYYKPHKGLWVERNVEKMEVNGFNYVLYKKDDPEGVDSVTLPRLIPGRKAVLVRVEE